MLAQVHGRWRPIYDSSGQGYFLENLFSNYCTTKGMPRQVLWACNQHYTHVTTPCCQLHESRPSKGNQRMYMMLSMQRSHGSFLCSKTHQTTTGDNREWAGWPCLTKEFTYLFIYKALQPCCTKHRKRWYEYTGDVAPYQRNSSSGCRNIVMDVQMKPDIQNLMSQRPV